MSIDALAKELMAREVNERPAQFDKRPALDLGLPPRSDVTPINPEAAALMGGLADAASTFSFLKRGTGVESNAMHQQGDPLKTAASVAIAALLGSGGRHILRKMGHPKIADLIAGAMGGQQMGLAAQNLQSDLRGGFTQASDDAVTSKVHGALMRRER
jgi:hypothetical protein